MSRIPGNPFQYQSSTIFGGTAPPGVPPLLPTPPGSPTLGMLINMFGPMLLGADGMRQMQFHPSISTFQLMQGMRYQQQLGQAMQAASAQDRRMLRDLILGFQRMSGLAATPQRIREADKSAGLVQGMLPFMAQIMPGAVSALFGERGSASLAAGHYMSAGRYLLDPVTGMQGFSGATSGAISQYIGRQLYGPAGIDPAVRGLPQDRLAQYMGLAIARGRGPAVLRSAVDSARLDRFIEERRRIEQRAQRLEALGPGGVAQAARLRQQAPRAADVFGGQLSADELQALDRIGGKDTAQILRRLDARRFQKWAKDQAGVLRALQDMFGPDTPLTQLVEAASRLTQRNVGGKTPAQLEMQLRTINQLAQASGAGLEGAMKMQPMLAAIADRNQLRADARTDLLTGALAFGTAFNNAGLSGIPGLDKDKMAIIHAQLTAQAEGSPLARQLAGVRRAARLFRRGTEIYAISEALKAGESTYMFQGQKRKLPTDIQQLRDIARRGGVDMGAFTQFLSPEQDAANRQLLRESPKLTGLVRRLQFEQDLQPALEARLTGSIARVGGIDAARARKITAQLMQRMRAAGGFKAYAKATTTEQRQQLLEKWLQGLGLTDAQRKAIAGLSPGTMEQFARDRGYDSFGVLLGEHDPGVLSQVEAARERGEIDAQIAKALSGLEGRGGLGRRLVESLLQAKKGDNFMDLLHRAFGAQQAGALPKALAPVADELLRLRDTAREKHQKAQGADGAIRGQLEKARDDALKRIQELVTGNDALGRYGTALTQALLPDDKFGLAHILTGRGIGKLGARQLTAAKGTFVDLAKSLKKQGKSGILSGLAEQLGVSTEKLLAGDFELDQKKAISVARDLLLRDMGLVRARDRIRAARQARGKAAGRPLPRAAAGKAGDRQVRQPAAAKHAEDAPGEEQARAGEKHVTISGILEIPGLGRGNVSATLGSLDHEMVS